MREDLSLVDHARTMGWEVDFHRVDKDNGNVEIDGPRYPNFLLQFKKGNKVIWKAARQWRCADLVNGTYVKHRCGDSLLEMLTKESEVAEEIDTTL